MFTFIIIKYKYYTFFLIKEESNSFNIDNPENIKRELKKSFITKEELLKKLREKTTHSDLLVSIIKEEERIKYFKKLLKNKN